MNDRMRGPGNRDRLPDGLRRLGNRRLLVDFQERFADGTAFRRTKEFEADELRPAIAFLEKAKADFARGNGVGTPEAKTGGVTVGSWSEYCVKTTMPAQRNGSRPKYSDEALEGFREVVRLGIVPRIGKVPIQELDKAKVTEFIASLPSDEARTKSLFLLTRVMEIAEAKGQRKKGTNPCKGVSTRVVKPDAEEPANWSKGRPANWRDREE